MEDCRGSIPEGHLLRVSSIAGERHHLRRGTSLNHFRSAINNDGDVTAADLTVTTSNFGNSEGFGAPPVYKSTSVVGGGVPTSGIVMPRLNYGKPVPHSDNSKATVQLRPLFDPLHPPLAGEVAGFEIAAVDLDDVAGYEFEIEYGGGLLRAVPERATKGDIFADNPYCSVFSTREVEGGLAVMGTRVGKEWSARAWIWWGASSAAKRSTGPGSGTGKCPRQGVPEATARAISRAR